MIVTSLLLALAAPNPASLTAPRKAYAACLRKFEASMRGSAMAADAYAAAAKDACPGERAGFVAALVAFDTAMGTKKAAAEQNAALDVEDQVSGSIERYRDDQSPQ